MDLTKMVLLDSSTDDQFGKAFRKRAFRSLFQSTHHPFRATSSLNRKYFENLKKSKSPTYRDKILIDGHKPVGLIRIQAGVHPPISLINCGRDVFF